MKMLAICSIVFLLAFPALAQDSLQMLERKDLLRKSKNKKTAGLVLTTAGSVGLIGTLLADGLRETGNAYITLLSLGTYEPEYKSYTGYYIASAACVAAGVTCFVAARKNRRRANAASINIRSETVTILNQTKLQRSSFATVALTVPL